jgi:hypothetical protein
MREKRGVAVQLDGGELLRLDTTEAEALYDELWRLAASTRGALSAAARIRAAQDSTTLLWGRVELLDTHESHAVETALRRP